MQQLSLAAKLQDTFELDILSIKELYGVNIIEVNSVEVVSILKRLKQDAFFAFEQLIDLTVVDKLHYEKSQWETQHATSTGFSRAVKQSLELDSSRESKARFELVYNLLSVSLNQRLIIKCKLDGEPPKITSAVDIYPNANWYEREAFDLFGVVFEGHPDLRRILTDYGFVGHPFRKDFPVCGHVEMHYDETKQEVSYRPVSIEPEHTVPKIIRHDNRYELSDDKHK